MPRKPHPMVGTQPPRTTTPPTRGAPAGGAVACAPCSSSAVKRRYLTKNERAAMAKRQGYKCGCGCGDPLSTAKRGTVAEHTAMVAMGNGEKPDHIRNKKCARRKTYGGQDGEQWSPVGGDIRDAAHIKRIRDGKTQHDKRLISGPKLKSNSKLQSAGFRKDVRMKMNRTVEPRSR